MRGLALTLVLVAAPAAAAAQQNGTAAAEPKYAEAQAARGATAFRQNCQSCHTSKQFIGSAFEKARSDQPLFGLFDQLRTTMPQDEPGRLSAQQYVDIIVYLLKENAYSAGGEEIPANDETLKKLKFRKILEQ